MSALLTRDKFRESVFTRDNHKCVVCGAPAVDAHHIIERRLFNDGGYRTDNGASLCSDHHLEAEKTNISVEEIREYAGITKIVLPDHMYSDVIYTKWGDIILENGTRIRGELFEDESVQKIIAEHLNEYVRYIKYPRTYHVPWSPGVTEDDRVNSTMSSFEGERVIVSLKADGENSSCYPDGYIHARSVDGRNHWSRDWLKNFAQTFVYDLDEDMRVCGENLYAVHSIQYDELESYFYGFSLWKGMQCLSWDDTMEYFKILGITPVEVIYDGIYDEKILKDLAKNMDLTTNEGYVVRKADSFLYRDFKNSVAKFVRANHVQTSKHWFFGTALGTNKLKG